jgi:trk system potassium uptake protein
MNFLIIGCGRVGSSLAHTLSHRGHVVTVIDKDPAAIAALGTGFSGQTHMGSAFDRDVLLQAGITRSDGLAAVTGSDETNVVSAQLARQVFQVPKAIARVYDPRKAEMYRRLGIQTLNPITWGSNRIAELLSYSHLDTIVSLGSGEVDVIEAEIPQLWVGRTVSEATVPSEMHVAAISRGGHTFLPMSGAVFHAGDVVHVVVQAASADRLKGFFGPP